MEKLTQLVLGNARDAVEDAKSAYGRDHLLVLGVQRAEMKTRDPKILGDEN